jgi:NitT/TauT family transport system substrate-binding protein
MVAEHPEVVQRFLRASLRGWRYAIANQSEAVDAVMRQDPKLDRNHQAVMMQEVSKLMLWGPGTTKGIGYIEADAVASAHRFLLEHGQIEKPVALDRAYTMRFWQT